MVLLILGVAIWWWAHLFKRISPKKRAGMGHGGKSLIAVGIVIGIVLMVIGYRSAAIIPVWYPPTFMVHINNLLVLVAIYLMSPAPKHGVLLNGMRHPMLTGFALWALAHLLVNGEVADLILFGGLLVWAIVEVRVINRAEPDWTPGEKGALAKDAMFLAASVILLAVIGYIHAWLGPWPFSG